MSLCIVVLLIGALGLNTPAALAHASSEHPASSPQTNRTVTEHPTVKLKKCKPTVQKKIESHRVRAESEYNGPLIDTHLHMPVGVDVGSVPTLNKDVTFTYLDCVLEKEGTTTALGFFAVFPDEFEEEFIEVARTAKEQYPKRFFRFLMPPGPDDVPPTATAKKIKQLLKRAPGVYNGYGEIGLYALGDRRDEDDYPPDAPIFQKIFPVVRKNNLLVYFHPGLEQDDNLANVLEANPDINFIVHGDQIAPSMDELMTRYSNLYFTVNDLYGDQYLLRTEVTKKEFLELTEDFMPLLEKDVADWKDLIEAHPNQFMWGTDRGGQAAWTYDVEVGLRLADYGRAFISYLDPSVQEKFAYKNARRLIKRAKNK